MHCRAHFQIDKALKKNGDITAPTPEHEVSNQQANESVYEKESMCSGVVLLSEHR